MYRSTRRPPPPPPPPPPKRPAAGQQTSTGGFGSSMAGAAVGSMVGSAIGTQLAGSKDEPAQATRGENNHDYFYGRCADKCASLLACAEYFGGNLDRCNKEFDELTSCHGSTKS